MKKLTLGFLCTLLISISLFSQENKGYQIVKKMIDANEGLNSSVGEILMSLKKPNGTEYEREILTKSLKNKDGDRKTILIFTSPNDIKGTSFLSHSNADAQTSQWIYMPANGRVKRVTSATEKDASFMSSEFTYEDMTSVGLDDNNYEYMGEKEFKGNACYVVKTTPKNPNDSQYKYTLALYNKNEQNRVEAIIFYDKTGRKLKTLTQSDYKKYANKYYIPGKLFMYNHQTKMSTTLLNKSIKVNVPIDENELSINAMKG